MDGRLILQWGCFCLLLVHTHQTLAYNEPLSNSTTADTGQIQRYTNANNVSYKYTSPPSQPVRFTLTPPKNFVVTPRLYGINFELTPSKDGQQKISAYPSLTLTPQSSLGFSLRNFRPRFDFEQGGFKTSFRLQSDGIKLNIRPSAFKSRLEFDIKITNDESRLDLTYRY